MCSCQHGAEHNMPLSLADADEQLAGNLTHYYAIVSSSFFIISHLQHSGCGFWLCAHRDPLCQRGADKSSVGDSYSERWRQQQQQQQEIAWFLHDQLDVCMGWVLTRPCLFAVDIFYAHTDVCLPQSKMLLLEQMTRCFSSKMTLGSSTRHGRCTAMYSGKNTIYIYRNLVLAWINIFVEYQIASWQNLVWGQYCTTSKFHFFFAEKCFAIFAH